MLFDAANYHVARLEADPATADLAPPVQAANDELAVQAGITATRKIVQKQPMIPALKAAIAHFGNDAQWKTCRPPLVELTSAHGAPLHSWRPLMVARRTMRSAVMTLTSMICAAASSVISPRSAHSLSR